MFKFVVVGEEGVGKSSFVLRVAENKFYPYLGFPYDYKIASIDVGGKLIKLLLWDFRE